MVVDALHEIHMHESIIMGGSAASEKCCPSSRRLSTKTLYPSTVVEAPYPSSTMVMVKPKMGQNSVDHG